MTWDQIEANWTKIKATVRNTWGKLTEDDFDRIAGQRDRLSVTRDQAEHELDLFERGLEAEHREH
jgi:uncharacterized protein YjbJ (UPF0337 family)